MPQIDTNIVTEQLIAAKITELNHLNFAVIFAVTGGNGVGKTHLAKHLLTQLPFHQSFNLGLITKTIRCLTDMDNVTMLENFRDTQVDKLFLHIIQYACAEYQRNGVNVLIDGVQVDSVALHDDDHILGGIILDVEESIKLQRNDRPTTHFKRKLAIHSETDMRRYIQNDSFKVIANNNDFSKTYQATLEWFNVLLDRKLNEAQSNV